MGIEDLGLLEKHWAVHVKAPWGLTAEFAKLVKNGAVVNFLDTKIAKNKTDFGAYLLSKKALAELTTMQAVRFAPRVRVNAVAPGLILAPEGRGPWYLKKQAAGIPLKRPGSIRNIIQAVRFLITNDYVTGQTIFVDGGEHLS
jgi:NAD(P)-dependent dehydrogenase (short-subunit alcohol dehydrogenase family)